MYKQLIFIYLLANAFFGLVFVDNGIYYLIMTVVELLFAVCYFSKIKEFNICFTFLFISILLNAISSQYFRGQDFFLTIRAARWVLMLTFYYMLHHYSPNIRQTETFIEKITIITLICYLVQVLAYPSIIFVGAGDWVQNNVNWFRGISVRADVLLSLGIFYGLNKYLMYKKYKHIYLCVICVLVYMMRGYRIMILGIIVSSIFLLFRFYGIGNIRKFVTTSIVTFIIAFAIGLIGYYNIPLVHSGINVILEKYTVGDATLSNDTYIRTLSFNYYENDHFKSIVERIFGSGIPQDSSKWGHYYLKYLLANRNYNYYDWGLFGLSWIGGIPLAFTIVLFYLKCIFTKVDKSMFYISAWFIFILIVSLTDPLGYSNNALVAESIVIYLVSKIRMEKSDKYK